MEQVQENRVGIMHESMTQKRKEMYFGDNIDSEHPRYAKPTSGCFLTDLSGSGTFV